MKAQIAMNSPQGQRLQQQKTQNKEWAFRKIYNMEPRRSEHAVLQTVAKTCSLCCSTRCMGNLIDFVNPARCPTYHGEFQGFKGVPNVAQVRWSPSGHSCHFDRMSHGIRPITSAMACSTRRSIGDRMGCPTGSPMIYPIRRMGYIMEISHTVYGPHLGDPNGYTMG